MTVDWDRVVEVAGRYRDRILSVPGVVGMSTGVLRVSGRAEPCIRVYLREPVASGKLEESRIPEELDGIRVDAVVTGDMVAFEGPQ